MSTAQSVAQSTADQPRASKYLLGAVIVWGILISLWFVLDIAILRPELQSRPETAMNTSSWIGVSAVAVVLLFGGLWLSASHQAQARERERKQQTEEIQKQQAQTKTEQGRREYVVEVIGLGVTLDQYRQGSLWDALQKRSPYTSIREQDPKKYDWSSQDKRGAGGGRACDALENGATATPTYWGVPSFYAGSPITDPNYQPSPNEPIAGLVAGADTTGMPDHLFVTAQWKLDERPDRLLSEVFAFFDTHPDVPYVVIASEDSLGTRDSTRPLGAPALLKDGYYITEMPDATALFVLARRERVEPMRPFIFDDLDDNIATVAQLNSSGFARRLFLAYDQLEHRVAAGERALDSNLPSYRQPLVSEWLPAAAAFAQRPEIRGAGLAGHLNDFNPWANRPPKDWKPTPWFPIPWNRHQMETFDGLPSLAFIHRPTFVKFTDEHGKPVTRRDQRQKILEAGWQQALQTLPEAERAKGPARIIAAANNNAEQLLALEGVLHQYAAQGGPEIDTGKTGQFINTDRRLGNTGAATFFMQMAIGVMGSYRAGGASAAINLRDPDEASIIFISPPSEEKRIAQKVSHGDVFRHKVGPAIDPASYELPSVESIISTQPLWPNSDIPLPASVTNKKAGSSTQ